jgi:hypothetical protein
MPSLRTSIAASAVIGVLLIVRAGFAPDDYLIYVRGILNSPYPIESVAFFCGLVIVECLVLYAVLTYPRSLGEVWRALTAFSLFAGWGFLLLVMGMHQAPHYFAHLVWALVVALVLFVNLVGTALRRALGHPMANRRRRV